MSLLERLEKQRAAAGEGEQIEKTPEPAYSDAFEGLKTRVHNEVIAEVNKRAGAKGQKNSQDEAGLYQLIGDTLEREAPALGRPDRERISRELYDDVAGLGPLQPLLDEEGISEIMVNGPYLIYIERQGKIIQSPVRFRDTEHVLNIIDRIVSTVGRHVDEASPMCDARLPDGSRVNVIIPPLALNGPTITIRKFSKKAITVADLMRFGSLSPRMVKFLEACVRGRMNIVVSGGTGSGKTTLLNVLSSFIPEDERIITIEDSAELRLRQKHVISLESRPANIEGRGQVAIRELVKNSLRMRPDRIVVGEVRSGETLDMLQAMNTGHDGSLTTAHANTPRDLLSRLETMVLMAGMDLPIRAIREQISSAVDLIVQQARLRDGSRKITNISEVVGMEGDVITLNDIFVLDRGDGGTRFRATGIRPGFGEKLKANGAFLTDDMFIND